MSGAPKISIPSAVRERLRAARVDSASHPDANLLSAFAENALSTGERAQVMEHVAGCAVCREVLAFAMPEQEPASAAQSSALGFHRLALSWTAARWTALAATAAVLVAVVFIYRVQPRREVRMASAPAASQNVRPNLAKTRQEETTRSGAAPSVAEREKVAQPAEKKELARNQEPGTKTLADNFKDQLAAKNRSAGSTTEPNRTMAKLDDTESQKMASLYRRQLSQDEKQAQFDKLSSAQGLPLPGQNMASPPQARISGGNATSLTTLDGAQSYAPSNEIRNAPAQSRPDVAAGVAGTPAPKAAPAAPDTSSHFRINAAAANKAKSPPPPTSESVAVTAEAPALQTQNASVAQTSGSGEVGKLRVNGRMLAAPPMPAKWRLQRDRVQRSLDGGATWSDIPIADQIAFNVVAAAGNQVWAAGSGAVLYHSSDGGATWSVQWSYARDATAQDAVRYPAAPARIYKLDISDALNGGFWVRVGGSAPQEFLFTSNDGGKHWYEETID